MLNLNQAKSVALLAAEKAGQHLRKNFGKRHKLIRKFADDYATEDDIIAEKLIIEIIKANFPQHKILAEEKKSFQGKSDYQWIIDPLDGSAHYNRGLPIFCVSIALRYRQKLVLGVVYNPITRQLFYAVKNQGAFLNDKKINVSKIKFLKKANIYIETPEIKFASQREPTEKRITTQIKDINCLVVNCASVESHRLGSWGLALVAMGAFDAYIDFSNTTKLWDVASGCILVREAGGKIYELPALKRGFVRICATNGLLDEEISHLLKTINLKYEN